MENVDSIVNNENNQHISTFESKELSKSSPIFLVWNNIFILFEAIRAFVDGIAFVELNSRGPDYVDKTLQTLWSVHLKWADKINCTRIQNMHTKKEAFSETKKYYGIENVLIKWKNRLNIFKMILKRIPATQTIKE